MNDTDQLASSPVPVRDAATVLMVRPDGPGGFRVYAQRRSPRLRAFAGVWAFPGGSVEPQDRRPEWRVLLAPFDERQATEQTVYRERTTPAIETRDFRRKFRPLIEKRIGNRVPDDPIPDSSLDPAANLASWVAAIRELFEETGVLLTEGEKPAVVMRVQIRQKVLNGDMPFADFLQEYGMRPAPGLLRYMGRLITPSTETRRFDTRFFLARLPEGQEPDGVVGPTDEAVEDGWFRPEEILDNRDGRFPTIPPTRYALQTIAAFRSLDELWAAFSPEPR
ncbi:MAG: hypothetical protein QJR06_10800 [Alicyclobacillaceae bacterium]|nr:hypothetical protein [Alicyclobacillaceae bacterium]